MGKVHSLPDVFVGEYDPLEFPSIVQSELQDRPPLVSTIMIVLDASGHLTIHTSSSDRERNMGLVDLTKQHMLNEFGKAIMQGFERDITVTGEDDG